MTCPEANFDILCLLLNSKKKFDDLNYAEINMLCYLALLLSIYNGKQSSDWGYVFSYHKYGGPFSNEIADELNTLECSGFIQNSGKGFFSVTDTEKTTEKVKRLSKFNMFSWRTKYIETSVTACLTKTLPKIFEAIKNEPDLSTAEKLGRKAVLHNSERDSLFEDFRVLKETIGDVRHELLVPASLWIDYLTLVSKQVNNND